MNLPAVLGVVLVGLSPWVGMAIGRSIKRRRSGDQAVSAQPRAPLHKTRWWAPIPAIVLCLIIQAVFSPAVAIVLLFALAAAGFAWVIVQQRRLHSGA